VSLSSSKNNSYREFLGNLLLKNSKVSSRHFHVKEREGVRSRKTLDAIREKKWWVRIVHVYEQGIIGILMFLNIKNIIKINIINLVKN